MKALVLADYIPLLVPCSVWLVLRLGRRNTGMVTDQIGLHGQGRNDVPGAFCGLFHG